MNCGGTKHGPWHIGLNPDNGPEAIWNRRKMTFAQLVERVKNMVVAPPDPNATYRWHDRTE